jgi:hypothetical protein
LAGQGKQEKSDLSLHAHNALIPGKLWREISYVHPLSINAHAMPRLEFYMWFMKSSRQKKRVQVKQKHDVEDTKAPL